MAEEIDAGWIALQIVTPVKQVADARVSIVSLPGVEGDFGAMGGHTPLLTMLRPGVIEYEEGGMPYRLAVSSGLVEVTQERVLVLARTCEAIDEIDVARARKSKERAESKLSGISHDNDQWGYQETRIKRAIARLSVAEG